MGRRSHPRVAGAERVADALAVAQRVADAYPVGADCMADAQPAVQSVARAQPGGRWGGALSEQAPAVAPSADVHGAAGLPVYQIGAWRLRQMRTRDRLLDWTAGARVTAPICEVANECPRGALARGGTWPEGPSCDHGSGKLATFERGAAQPLAETSRQTRLAFWTRDRTRMTMSTEDGSSFKGEGKRSHA